MTFDTKAFLEFCRSKGDEEYPRLQASRCALAQYGFPGLTSGAAIRLGIPGEVYAAAVWDARGRGEATFSALADRLEKLV